MTTTAPRVKSLGYLGLRVSDIAAWERYFTQVLGMQLGAELPGGQRLVRMDDYGQRVVLQAGDADDVAFTGWEVADLEELAAMRAHLRAKSVEAADMSRDLCAARGVEAAIVFDDCDGLRTEIYCGPRKETRQAFHAEQAVGSFVTGELGMGHIVLRVADRDRAESFYRDVLGLRLTDHIDLELGPGLQVRATFMRCNARHHSLAVLAAPLPKRLLHFMAEVRELDEVGRAIERAGRAGFAISATLGRHTNDRMISAYLQSPSGFEVEYGCGGRLIDEQRWSLETYDKAEVWGHRRG